MKRVKNAFFNLVLPCVILPAFAGMLAGSCTIFYKGAAEKLGELSKNIYTFSREHLWMLPILIVILLGVAFVQSLIIKRIPSAKGGGIPTSEGYIRGSLEYPPLITLVATVILSFISYLIGLPLGCEGPSVQIGSCIGSLTAKMVPNKEEAYKKYIMTGASSTAFSVATGSPITGIIFALEEIHRKFSPMITLVAFSSVVAGSTLSYFISSRVGIDPRLFHFEITETMSMRFYFLMIPLGISIGLIAVGYNHTVKLLQKLMDKKMKAVPLWIKLSISFLVTLAIGIVLPDFLGGGGTLIPKLSEGNIELYLLLILLVLKLFLIAWVSQSGATGGMFIPILTIGALVGAILAKVFQMEVYGPLIVAISMAAFMAASIGCPLSALVFGVEALSLTNNVLPLAITLFFAYVTARVLKTTHVYDIVLERKLHKDYGKKEFMVIDAELIVSNDAFAIDKQVRDLLFSANILILSIQRANKDYGKMDNFGDKFIHENDTITFRVQTYDIEKTRKELEAFIGKQEDFKYSIVQNEK